MFQIDVYHIINLHQLMKHMYSLRKKKSNREEFKILFNLQSGEIRGE
jgi:hypothetical protein